MKGSSRRHPEEDNVELYKGKRTCELQHQQGWTDEAMLCLALHFISMRKQTTNFEKYLEEVAEDEADEEE
jgi:hypothetical protein